ncbi:MAG: gamma-glutamylcyclotransferase [Chlorobium sp.]|nr:gamma-glutamylcyclotransferase [Chlorobium sp.]
MELNSDIKIFVYGTLKRGFSNHHFLMGSRFIGTGRTVEKYAMHTEGGIPFVVENEPVSYIYGELFSVDGAVLQSLDRLERHPTWYRRREIDICLDGGTNPPMKVWMYFIPHHSGKIITTGEFTERY